MCSCLHSKRSCRTTRAALLQLEFHFCGSLVSTCAGECKRSPASLWQSTSSLFEHPAVPAESSCFSRKLLPGACVSKCFQLSTSTPRKTFQKSMKLAVRLLRAEPLAANDAKLNELNPQPMQEGQG